MKNYPSNITRQQFELIRPALENFRKRTKPRKYVAGKKLTSYRKIDQEFYN